MYDFWFGTIFNHIGLEGFSQLDPVKGYLTSTATKGETTEQIEDLLTVTLEDRNLNLLQGNPPTIASVMSFFEFLLKKARLYFETGLGERVLLHAEPTAGEVWESQVIGGWTEFTPKGSESQSRLWGTMVLTVHLRRVNFWQQPEVQLETSSPNGYEYWNGSTRPLMSFTTLANALLIDPTLIVNGPELPSPLRIQIENLTSNIGKVFVAQNINSEPVSRNFTLDDLDGTGPSTATIVDAVQGYGGTYKNCSFTGPGQADLLVWPMATDFCADCAGNFFRFVFRVGSVLLYSDIEFKVQLRLHGLSTVVGETAWTLGSTHDRLQVLGTMRVPPYPLSDFALSASLDLVLMARRQATGTWVVAVDFLQLLPLDGWREYDSLYTLQAHWKINDDANLGIVYTYDTAGTQQVTHIARGQPFFLAPHTPNSFFFLWMDDTGYVNINAQIKVTAFCCFRRRLL